jgi:hypothetical protein
MSSLTYYIYSPAESINLGSYTISNLPCLLSPTIKFAYTYNYGDIYALDSLPYFTTDYSTYMQIQSTDASLDGTFVIIL